ncbi:MAG: hypothetical protein HY908_10520 [Myxococcales bacterium]|nr:hypothetical protein [Myxococcales bacterium]
MASAQPAIEPPAAARPRAVGAIACAAPPANAVGIVRLALGREALVIELCRVGRFASGFVLPGLGQSVRMSVPYSAVRALVRRGPHLHLELDPRVARPFNRFALARFGRQPAGALLARLWSGRLVGALGWVVPPVLAGAAVALVPRSLASGVVGLGAVALVAALVAFAALRRLGAWLTGGGPLSQLLARRFERDLGARLGLEPLPLEPSALDFVPDGGEAGELPLPGALGAFWRLLGTSVRPRALLASAVAVGGAVALAVALGRYGVVRAVELPVASARSGALAGAGELVETAAAALVPSHPGCACGRPDSPVWRDGLPQLSFLVVPRRGDIDGPWLEPGVDVRVKLDDAPGRRGARAPRAPRLELEVAAVNNGTTPLAPVTAVLTFARRNARGERVGFVERGMYWPKLGPGEAVKWRLKGQGTELRIETPLLAAAAPGELVPASADKLAALGRAKLPEVRLHAAMLLRYLGDARAAEVLGALGDGGKYAALVAELERVARPLSVCDVRVGPSSFVACLHNGTGELVRGVALREIGGKARAWRLEDLFYPGRGLEVTLPLDDGGAPAEVVAEPIVP